MHRYHLRLLVVVALTACGPSDPICDPDCDDNATCTVDDSGKASCACEEGFVGNGSICHADFPDWCLERPGDPAWAELNIGSLCGGYGYYGCTGQNGFKRCELDFSENRRHSLEDGLYISLTFTEVPVGCIGKTSDGSAAKLA